MNPRTRLLVLVCQGQSGRGYEVTASLVTEGFDVRSCGEAEDMIEAVMDHRPRAVIYTLAHCPAVDLAVLRLLRSVAADVPLVIVGDIDRSVHAGALESLRSLVLSWAAVAAGELPATVRKLAARSRRTAAVAG